ncbi:hypothetical protein [Myroides odoratus]|uniref:hypothetical protein n=1 Tax=Myroides odoratus TaxID=256 RepID=UPI0039B0CDC6
MLHYNIDDLELKNNSENEQIRTRRMFEDLLFKCNQSTSLSEHEKDFLCLGLKLSLLNDGNITDCPCCHNYKFKMIYHSYFHDLSGNGRYEKVRNGKIYPPSQYEIKKDLLFLEKTANQWQKTIEVTNHPNELLQEVSKEIRSELKQIEKNKGFMFFKREKDNYTFHKRNLLLQSKYIYTTILLMLEKLSPQDLQFTFNGETIESTNYSLVHILNRHFSQIIKQNKNKTYHSEDIDFMFFPKQVKEIFKTIEDSKLLETESIESVFYKKG